MSQALTPVPDSPAGGRPVRVSFTVRTVLFVTAIVGLVAAFIYIQEAVLTLFLALFSALVLEPVVRLMVEHSENLISGKLRRGSPPWNSMQQRALIAKALASEPTLLALDEPTTGVDAASQESLGLLLEELREELHVTILYVSHEFGAVEHVVSRLVLVRGRIVFDGDPAQLPALWHDPSHTH